ncbi:MAG: tripartite tricarboxylate transporter substrate binding protein [Betaproteobacteria bacterium]|nr:tripartite tricarboxylate transporter substrate binding protein [Betaproteobacteria bacterium]
MAPGGLVLSLFSASALLGTGSALGQDYPNKPIHIITAPPGASGDFAARLIAQGLTASLGRQVIVENRTGFISIESVAKAPPDGYTLLLLGNTIWVMPLLRGNASWDPIRDFSPITLAATTPGILVVHASLPVKSVKELIALAKARPGELNYGSTATGATNHLAGELFKSMAKVNIVHVPYNGGGPALNGLITGEVQLMFPAAGSVTPLVRSGRLKALAVASAQPSALVPGLPTVASAGLPGFEMMTMTTIFAPAKTPVAIINRLNQEIVRVVNKPDVKARFFDSGSEVVGSSPEQLGAAMQADMSRLTEVAKTAGIHAK